MSARAIDACKQNPAPGVARMRKQPKFDLVLLELLDDWKKALMQVRRCDHAIAAATSSMQKAANTQGRDKASVGVRNARMAFEAALKADAAAAVE